MEPLLPLREKVSGEARRMRGRAARRVFEATLERPRPLRREQVRGACSAIRLSARPLIRPTIGRSGERPSSDGLWSATFPPQGREGIRPLPPPDERHLGRHQRHRQHVRRSAAGSPYGRSPRRPRRTSIVGSTAMRRRPAARPAVISSRHVGRGVADIDLAAGDVESAPVERERLGQAGDGVLGRGIGRA